MKRSEMLDILKDAYRKTQKYPALIGRNVDLLLKVMEEAGMLPPKTIYEIKEGTTLRLEENRWEKEDENTKH